MLETKIRLKVGNLSDIGKVRESNQDYYGKYEGQFGTLYIVCDGRGGHAGGDKASRLAVDKIRESFFQLTSPLTRPLGEIMADSIVYAHNQIMDYASRHPDKTGMGTTVVMLLIQGDTWWIAHVGDSRIYMKRKGKITQLTKDHSVVQRMVDEGILNAEQAKGHPLSNRITKALGSVDYQPDVSGPNPLYKGDTFLLCTDGLHQYFDEQELLEALAGDPQDTCAKLVATAKQRGGSDNITLQIVKAVDGDARGIPERKKPGYRKVLPMVAMFFLVLVGGIMLIPKLLKDKPAPPVPSPDINSLRYNPDDKLKYYKEFVDNLTSSNQLLALELKWITRPLGNQDKIMYLSRNHQINLVNFEELQQKLSRLNISDSNNVRTLLVLTVTMCKQTGQFGDSVSPDKDLLKHSLIEEALNILAKYNAGRSNSLLTADQFQRSIRELQPHLRFGTGSISLVEETRVEYVKEPTTEKPTPPQSRRDTPSTQQGKGKGHVKDDKKGTPPKPTEEQPSVDKPPKNTDKPETINKRIGDKDATQS